MKCQILAVGLKTDLLSHCREYFMKRHTELKNTLNLSEAVSILKREPVHLLVLDVAYLRSKKQGDWIANIRYVSFIPIIILTDVLEADVASCIDAGADVCFDNKLPASIITLLLSAQLRRYTEYNHFQEPETSSFQVGDIAIDPAHRLVWARGEQVNLRPREFNLLLYFMQNPDVVLTADQICEHAWKKDYLQSVVQSICDLRKKIESNPADPTYIKTVYRVGYRFTTHHDETCDN